MSVLLLVVCALCLLAVVYPYAIYPAILARLPERPLRPVAEVPGRTMPRRLSLAFCASNEAAGLPAKIVNLRRLRRAEPTLELVTTSDLSCHRTRRLGGDSDGTP